MDLIVQSFEGDIYLAYRVQGQDKSVLTDGNQQPIRFRSLNQIRDYCVSEPFASATLVHDSAYDEMCGVNCGTQNMMEIDLKWY